jgi:hypothetical protein
MQIKHVNRETFSHTNKSHPFSFFCSCQLIKMFPPPDDEDVLEGKDTYFIGIIYYFPQVN